MTMCGGGFGLDGALLRDGRDVSKEVVEISKTREG